MSKQPEAIRLAAILESSPLHTVGADLEAAAELRRQHGEIESMRAERLRTEQRLLELVVQRDELLEALKKIAAIEDQMYGNDWEEIEEARAIARAAIAKAEGKQ